MGRGLTGDCKNTGVRGMAVTLRQSDEGLPRWHAFVCPCPPLIH